MRPISPELAGQLVDVARAHGTPAYVYEDAVIDRQVRALAAFDVVRFAQKACSNVHILRRMRERGVCVDAVSRGELERAVRAGYTGEGSPAGVVYTADVIDAATLDRIVELDVPLNAGSADMLDQLGARRRGHRVWLRINPGFGHGHSRKTNTGGESSKHGIWHEDVGDALRRIARHDLELVGLHMHIGSGADFEHLNQVCRAMVDQVRDTGADLEAISGGGGLPIPYAEGDAPFDTGALYACWDRARREIECQLGHAVKLEIEPGRYLVAESGFLLAEVRATKGVRKNRFVLVDAGFDNLMRPVLYGSYHAISILDPGGALRDGPREPTVVAGPLCESGDVFTQADGGVVVPRDLPAAQVGDIVVFHDTGAYGASMASNYNSRPLAPEILLEAGGPRLIRRRQTIDDLLALEQV